MPCGASVQVSGAAANWVGEGHDSTHAEALGAQMLSTLTLPGGHDAQLPSGVWYRPNPHATHSPYVHDGLLASHPSVCHRVSQGVSQREGLTESESKRPLQGIHAEPPEAGL